MNQYQREAHEYATMGHSPSKLNRENTMERRLFEDGLIDVVVGPRWESATSWATFSQYVVACRYNDGHRRYVGGDMHKPGELTINPVHLQINYYGTIGTLIYCSPMYQGDYFGLVIPKSTLSAFYCHRYVIKLNLVQPKYVNNAGMKMLFQSFEYEPAL